MPRDDERLAELWYQALRAEIGITIPTDPKHLKHFRNSLYRTREMLGDPALDEIIMITPPSGKEVWLCHKATNLEE